MVHSEETGSWEDLRLDFDRRVRLEFRGTRLSSDGGLLLVSELHDALGLSDLESTTLVDNRTGASRIHHLTGLFRQGVTAASPDIRSATVPSMVRRSPRHG